jgi:VanZ family protein
MPGKNIPKVGIIQADKYVHFVLFSVWIVLISYGIHKIWGTKNSFQFTILIAAFFGALLGIAIEFLQIFVPGRSFSFYDMFANLCGISFGYICIAGMFRKKRTA